MTTKRKSWIQWCGLMVGETVALLSICAAFTGGVDPYQIFHRVSTGKPFFDLRLQRFHAAGLARSSDYEIALLGTSMLQNIPNSAVSRMCGGRAVNLCIAGASIHEEAAVLRLAMKHAGTRTVIATLDFNSLSGGSEGQVIGIHEVFPEYLYTDWPFDRVRYLLSWDSVLTAKHVLDGVPAAGEHTNADWPWKFPESMTFAARNAVEGIDPANINRKFGMTNMSLAFMQQSFSGSIWPVLDAHPDVRVHFVFPPYSILAWHDFAQRGQLDVYYAFKKWLLAQESVHPNFDVVDFQDRGDVITNMSLYADIYHSNEHMDEEIVDAVCNGRERLDSRNVEARFAKLRELVKSTDPAAIVSAAKNDAPPLR